MNWQRRVPTVGPGGSGWAGGQPWLCMPADNRFSSDGSNATR